MDLPPFFQFAISGLTQGCIYAMVGLGLVLCVHVSSVINFAQGEYAMLGGIAVAIAWDHGVGLLAAVPIAALAGAGVGALQERLTVGPALERALFIKVTITIVAAVVIRTTAMILGGKDPLTVPGFSGDGAFMLLGAVLPVQSLWIWATTAILLIGTFWFLMGTNPGRAVRACSMNPVAARLMGVDVARLRLLVFMLSGGVGALVGAVVAPLTQAYWLTGLDFSLKGFIGAIIGGFRSPVLAVVGGLAIGVAEALAAGYVSSAFKDAIVYGLLLLYLLVQGGVFATGRVAIANQRG